MLCALAGITLATGQSLNFPGDDKDPEEPESGGLLNADLMPDGGILRNVLIPQYDQNLVLAATLRAEEMKISVVKSTDKPEVKPPPTPRLPAGKPAKKSNPVEIKWIDALKVQLEFLNPDRTARAKIDMATARYDAQKQLLTSEEPVSLVSDDLTAKGSSLVYDLKNTRGFLRGPVTATTKIDQSTSMNTQPVRQALAAGSLMMAAAASLPAQEPPAPNTLAEKIAAARLSEDQLAALDRDAESREGIVQAAAETAAQAYESALQASEKASDSMAGFLRAAAMTVLLAEPHPTSGANDVPRPNLPANPAQTRITSDNGAFFDSKEGLLVFLKNVVVADPRFSLTGADEVKVFFDSREETEAARAKVMAEMKARAEAKAKAEGKHPATVPDPPAAEEDAGKKEKAGLADAKFGEPNRIIATGSAVVVEYRADGPDGEAVKASARTVIYDLKKGEFILRGGSPWLLREGQLSSVPGNDAYIVIQKDGSFVTGNGGIDAKMDITEKKEDDKKTR